MNDTSTRSPRLVILISGGGTTLNNLLLKRSRGELPGEIVLVLSSTPRAGGLRIARQAGVPTLVVDRKAMTGEAEYSQAVFDACRSACADWVLMGGFLTFVLIPADFENRVLNIHPALIPAFCGRGFYGLRVHEAVLEYGAKVSGCTVHFVDNQYDHGPIILQKVVAVLDDDTPETLAARVFQSECEAYPEAIRWLAGGRVCVSGRRVMVR